MTLIYSQWFHGVDKIVNLDPPWWSGKFHTFLILVYRQSHETSHVQINLCCDVNCYHGLDYIVSLDTLGWSRECQPFLLYIQNNSRETLWLLMSVLLFIFQHLRRANITYYNDRSAILNNTAQLLPSSLPWRHSICFGFFSVISTTFVYRMVHVLFTLFIVVFNTYCVVFCFPFLCVVYPMLPVSLDLPLMIAPSVFSNVYLSITCSNNNIEIIDAKIWRGDAWSKSDIRVTKKYAN